MIVISLSYTLTYKKLRCKIGRNSLVGMATFADCLALLDLVCGKLEMILSQSFRHCNSLRSINLPSARIVTKMAFDDCVKACDGGEINLVSSWKELRNMHSVTATL